MPNWCKNNLKIIGNGEKILEVLELLKGEDGEMTFEKIAPTPKELLDRQAPAPKETLEDKALNNKLIGQYGAADWYDWRCQNWGVKWDASESGFWKDGDDWIVSFETPWGPPIEFLKKVSRQFNKITFELQFADETQSGYPLGIAIFEDGQETVDGPIEGTSQAEEFAEMVWDEEWVDDWTKLEGKEERLKYLLEKERTCGLDKEERYELEKLKGGNM